MQRNLSLYRYINTSPLPFDILKQACSSYGPNCMRETADESKSLYAKVLKENTYMNDICHSVHTVQGAEHLTADMDNVLSQGGFQVK